MLLSRGSLKRGPASAWKCEPSTIKVGSPGSRLAVETQLRADEDNGATSPFLDGSRALENSLDTLLHAEEHCSGGKEKL